MDGKGSYSLTLWGSWRGARLDSMFSRGGEALP